MSPTCWMAAASRPLQCAGGGGWYDKADEGAEGLRAQGAAGLVWPNSAMPPHKAPYPSGKSVSREDTRCTVQDQAFLFPFRVLVLICCLM